MITLNLSAGAVFSLGLITGILVGVIGLISIAYTISKKKK